MKLMIILISLTSMNLFAAQKPNIIFILVDDLSWNNLGCFGSPFFETPELDKLSKSAMRFTQAYAAHPVCSPTRAAIMTGKNPARIKITDWIPGKKGEYKLLAPKIKGELPANELTIAEVLKKNGYKTFYAGKWHLGGDGSLPENHGFDINIGGGHFGSPPGGYYGPFTKNKHMKPYKKGDYLTDVLTDECIAFMNKNKDQPFFMYFSMYNVHTPIQACKKHINYFKEKANRPKEKVHKDHDCMVRHSQDNIELASMVYAMDENIGRLLKKVKSLGIDKNTVIIFTSDNGGFSMKKTSGPNTVYPLRGGKGWCYEGGIRVPTMIYVPGLTEGNKSSNVPTVSMDFYPTILELAGIELMPEQHIDGISMLKMIKGEKINREKILWHYPHYHGSNWTPGSAIRHGDWKLIDFYHYEKIELYNLKDDPGEQNNLANKMPEKVKEMHEQLKLMLKENKADMPKKNPQFDPSKQIQKKQKKKKKK